jgi:hypothetical protein
METEGLVGDLFPLLFGVFGVVVVDAVLDLVSERANESFVNAKTYLALARRRRHPGHRWCGLRSAW